jgi:hypothetical protein
MNAPRQIWPLSPLIQITLGSLYLALTLPLPFLAVQTNVSLSPLGLGVAIALGFLFLMGILSEQVISTEEGLQVGYPRWVFWLSGKGWSISWQEIQSLKMRTTGQGGLVYYLIGKDQKRAYLLPQRIRNFQGLISTITTQTGIDTTDVRSLAQPWMYWILLGLTVLLGLVDLLTVTTVLGSRTTT